MRPAIGLAGIIAAAIVGAGIFTSVQSGAPFQLVPPEPSFGEEDRVAQTEALPTPYSAEADPSENSPAGRAS